MANHSPLLEANKKPGVHYALTPDGLELPIVDVTHPAFALSVTATEQQERVEAFLKETRQLQQLPELIRTPLLRFLLRGSVLARGIRQSQGSFMAGMDTYLLKLGPEMLGNAYAKPIDRKIAASLPSLGVRLRLQDIAQMLADCLSDGLSRDPLRPVHLLNIAGGPAIDSLNALILLSQKYPKALAARKFIIDVLDLDEAGPDFGEAALKTMSQNGGPLCHLSCTFRRIRYDWSKADDLQPLLRDLRSSNALAICSSEGGLFEYGSDQEILSNLRALRQSESVLAAVGSVTRADEATRLLHQTGGAALHLRGLPVFRALAQEAGWNVTRVVERPFSDHFTLTQNDS
ncbi:MAG TPA: hypothetical protein VMG82_14700 [Candidatus Sulfotelmatobacter sp.]|nr:hypothetical protein [Candidatus Sulfotelmatobacter sp.]